MNSSARTNRFPSPQWAGDREAGDRKGRPYVASRQFTHVPAWKTWLYLLLLPALLSAGACSSARKGAKGAAGKPAESREMKLRRDVVTYARQHIGSPYKYAGRNPRSGFDCSGFTAFVLKKYHITLSPASAEQAKQGRPVPLDRVQPGDLIIFGDKNRIQHVALVTERTRAGIICVHSTTSSGVIEENVTTSKYWKPLILYARDVIRKP